MVKPLTLHGKTPITRHWAQNKSQLPQMDTRDALPIVLSTKVDAHCDQLATDYHRQFITLSVHLS